MAMIPAQTLKRVLARADNLSPRELQSLYASLTKEIDAQCAEDGLFWLKFVKTRDEADPETPIKPFPLHEEYVKLLWADLTQYQKCIIAKSRQMLVSWVISSFCVHWARYKPNQAVYIQMQGWPDAVGMVSMPDGGFEGRMQFIETHLPEWMRQKAKFTEGRIQYPNGSIIQALAGGSNQIRSKTYSLYVGDEFAFQEDQTKTWTAVAPLVQKGAKLILCSTPNGSANEFATLFHGTPVTEARLTSL